MLSMQFIWSFILRLVSMLHVSLCGGGSKAKQGYNWNVYQKSYIHNWWINLRSKDVTIPTHNVIIIIIISYSSLFIYKQCLNMVGEYKYPTPWLCKIRTLAICPYITPLTIVTITCDIQSANVVTMAMKVLHKICNMCIHDLPDMYAWSPQEDLHHIIALLIVVLDAWLLLATTLSAVCLHVIINSCLKWLILNRPWPLPDIRPLVAHTGQTNTKHQMVLSTFLYPGCFWIVLLKVYCFYYSFEYTFQMKFHIYH